MHYSGEGTPKNHKKALYWFTKAAEQGYDKAQNVLDKFYK
jgi:TPR repeat protein